MSCNMLNVAALLILPMLLFAQPEMGEEHFQKQREGMQQQLRKELGLSESQTEQLKQFRKSMRQKSMPLKKELRSLRQQVLSSFDNSSEVKKIAKRTGEIHSELTILMASHLKDISTVLSQEQMQKLQELKGRGKHQRKGKPNKQK